VKNVDLSVDASTPPAGDGAIHAAPCDRPSAISSSGLAVYCARDGQTVILLLCGDDKRTQQADLMLRLFSTLYQKIPSSLKGDIRGAQCARHKS